MKPAGSELNYWIRGHAAKPGNASPTATNTTATFHKSLQGGGGDAPLPSSEEQHYFCDDTSTTTTALLSTSGVYSEDSSNLNEHSSYCWSSGVVSPSSATLLSPPLEKKETAAISIGKPAAVAVIEKEEEDTKLTAVGWSYIQHPQRRIALTPPGEHFIGTDRWSWPSEDFSSLDSVLRLQSYLCNPPVTSSRKTSVSESTSAESFASTQWGDDDGRLLSEEEL